LEPASSPRPERAAELHQLLDHLVLLVHLDRIHAAVAPVVAVLADRVVEAADQRLHAALEDVGEAHEQRHAEAAALEILDQVVEIEVRAIRALGRHLDVAGGVDPEVAARPARDVVQGRRIRGGPGAKLLQSISFDERERQGAPARHHTIGTREVFQVRTPRTAGGRRTGDALLRFRH
jgi:hypothetical protein